MRENKKIRLLFNTKVLISYFKKDAQRSGIYFVTYNLLQELSKREEVEITIFYEYNTYKYILELKRLGVIPENCKILDRTCIINKFFGDILDYSEYLVKKYPKTEQGDNIFKKGLRFLLIRMMRLFHNYFSIFYKYAKDYDAFFSPCERIPDVIKKANNIKTYLLLHDAIPIIMKDFYAKYKKAVSGMVCAVNSVNTTDKYFTVSENTKKDFLSIVEGAKPENFIVTYNGVNKDFYPITDSEQLFDAKNKYNIPQNKKYIFSLCTLEPRKNILFAIKNYIEFINKNNLKDIVLVLGGDFWEEFKIIFEKEFKNFEQYKDSIIMTGYIDDDDLKTLYSGAECFIYPSLYEGFGMPILEAMQCGCPVITSNTSSMPEVIGDCGIQIDPTVNNDLIIALEKMIFNDDFRKKCSKKGLERAKEFSWEKTVDIMVQTFRRDVFNETTF